jgi:hypothetical protein
MTHTQSYKLPIQKKSLTHSNNHFNIMKCTQHYNVRYTIQEVPFTVPNSKFIQDMHILRYTDVCVYPFFLIVWKLWLLWSLLPPTHTRFIYYVIIWHPNCTVLLYTYLLPSVICSYSFPYNPHNVMLLSWL